MENLTTAISVQINAKDKQIATEILQKLGVTMSGLINMTIKQLIMRNGIPFDVTIPNDDEYLHKYFSEDELENTSKELNYMEQNLDKYKSYNNMTDLKKDLLSNEDL